MSTFVSNFSNAQEPVIPNKATAPRLKPWTTRLRPRRETQRQQPSQPRPTVWG